MIASPYLPIRPSRIMIFWAVIVILCLLLHYAPIIIFNAIINLFDLILMLAKELSRRTFRGLVAASGILWILLTLPDYMEMHISSRANHCDGTLAPDESGGPINSTVTPSTSPSGAPDQIGSPVDHPIMQSASPNEDHPGSGSAQRCGGHTINGSPCKREKMMRSGETGGWYCRDHIKQRSG